MNRTHLAVLLSLIGSVAPPFIHQALAQDDGRGVASRPASAEAGEAAIRNVLGLSTGTTTAAPSPVVPPPVERRLARPPKAADVVSPTQLVETRWDRAALGLAIARPSGELNAAERVAAVPAVDASSAADQRIRAILGLEQDRLNANMEDGARRLAAHVPVETARGEVALARRAEQASSRIVAIPRNPEVNTLVAEAPTATMVASVIPSVTSSTPDDDPFRRDSDPTDPARQRRERPLPAIGDSPSPTLSRRGGLNTPTSLGLPPDEVETLDRVLRIRLNGRFHFDADQSDRPSTQADAVSDDPMLGLLDALAERDATSRRATEIVYVAPNPEDPKRAVIAANVFRQLADRIGRGPDAACDVAAVDDIPSATEIASVAAPIPGTIQPDHPALQDDSAMPATASSATPFRAPAIALWLEDIESNDRAGEQVAAAASPTDLALASAASEAGQSVARQAGIGFPQPLIGEAKAARTDGQDTVPQLAATAAQRMPVDPPRSNAVLSTSPAGASIDDPRVALLASETRATVDASERPTALANPPTPSADGVDPWTDVARVNDVRSQSPRTSGNRSASVFIDIFDPTIALPYPGIAASDVEAASSNESADRKVRNADRRRETVDRQASSKRRRPGAEGPLIAAMRTSEPAFPTQSPGFSVAETPLPSGARQPLYSPADLQRIAREMLGVPVGQKELGARSPSEEAALADLASSVHADESAGRTTADVAQRPLASDGAAAPFPAVATAGSIDAQSRDLARNDVAAPIDQREAKEGTVGRATASQAPDAVAAANAGLAQETRVASGSVSDPTPMNRSIERHVADRAGGEMTAADTTRSRLPDVALAPQRFHESEATSAIVEDLSSKTVAPALVEPLVFEADENRLSALQGTLVAIGDTRLESMRGGFETDSGLKVSFGIERAVYINGALVTTTSLNVADLSRLSAGQATIAGLDRGSLGIIQSGGNNNAFTSGSPISTGGIATVVQNTLNDQKIQGITAITATVNSLNLIQRSSLQQSLQSALTDSIRH